MNQTLKRTNAGFTLIQILIVVVIIGLLATIAVPSYVRARDASQVRTCVKNLRQIQDAKTQYALEANLGTGSVILPSDLDPYLKTPMSEMTEPSGGTYNVRGVGRTPTCSEGGLHTLD